MRQRGERLERPFAHLYETGGMRRVYLRGHPNILKRLLVHTAGFNLELLLRWLTGVGTPRSLQGRVDALLDRLITLAVRIWTRLSDPWGDDPPSSSFDAPVTWRHEHGTIHLRIGAFTTGC